MSIETYQITVAGETVDLVRKNIKNLHLAVYPPTGRLRVAVPLHINDEAVRLAVITRLGWIRRQQCNLREQPRMSPREYISGESHYFQGRRYRMDIVTSDRSSVRIRNRSIIEMHVPPTANHCARERLMESFYRQHLASKVPPLLTKWSPIIGVEVSGWSIRMMKNKWGSCNERTGRICLNLDLARMPVRCLEYVVIHELAHLIARKHDERFYRILEAHLPLWRQIRDSLNGYPLLKSSE